MRRVGFESANLSIDNENRLLLTVFYIPVRSVTVLECLCRLYKDHTTPRANSTTSTKCATNGRAPYPAVE